MPSRTTRPGILSLLFFLLAGTSLSIRANGQVGDIAVLINPKNPATNISLVDLRKMFSGEKRTWPGGLPVRLIVRQSGCHERLTMLRLLGMSEREYKQFWTAQVFRGEADSEPVAVPSFGIVKESVEALPGGISFVEAQSIKPGMYVKVIKVDGHLPGEPGYPLK